MYKSFFPSFQVTLTLFLSLFYLCNTVFSQLSEERIQVLWEKNKSFVYGDKTYAKPHIANQEFSGYAPNVSVQHKVPGNTNYEVQIKNIVSEKAPAEDLVFLKDFLVQVNEQLQWESKTVNAGTTRHLNISFLPYIIRQNEIQRITEVEFTYTATAVKKQSDKDFANISVLADAGSEWYKISLTADGIYKLDKNWFAAQNIALDGVSPDHIHLYGNANGKMSEKNSDPRIDDLAENDILFIGNGDANWDDNEYFLFYGWGPHKWKGVGGTFRRDLNIYSDVSNYFIRISSTESPNRITEVVSTTATETQTVTSFNHFDVYEQDLVNLVGGGQRWYGDLFDYELTRTFNFSTPNLVSGETIHFITSLASNSSTSANTYNLSSNGTTLYSDVLGSTSTDYRRFEVFYDLVSSAASIPITMTVNRAIPTTLTYLDRIELNARRNLVFTGTSLQFRDYESVGAGNIAQFQLSNVPSGYFIWDITNRLAPKIISGQTSGSSVNFNVASDSLREFICSDGLTFNTPTFVKKVENQNLHGLDFAKLLIVTHPDLLSEANRLADIHRADNVTTHVVTTEQVYNEFSSGTQDPTAIKWFAKMFYDKAEADPAKMPDNLLLFGDATYDPKNRVSGNNYMVPTYQFLSSEDHINALVTDDYFGMLDDNEAIENSDMMDIGVGRMIVTTIDQAREQVDKVVQYMREGMPASDEVSCGVGTGQACSSFGDWRLKYVQIADDEENGYFILNDTEPQYTYVDTNFREMNADKLYLDAYTQVTNAGGQRYPDATNDITDRVQRGSLIINYVGHGGEVGAAEERVITIPQIQGWTNYCKLNLFVSATCEFTRFDDPARISAGEWAFLNSGGGAIALMTTTRSVFFGVNTNVGKSFYRNVFQRDAANKPLSFGQIMKNTKNQAGINMNKRSFNLIGDPALRIALPEFRIAVDSINGMSPALVSDTLRALSKVRINGHVEDYAGNKLSGFNGQITPAVFDKKKVTKTLGQDSDSPQIDFDNQKNLLYKGKSTVTNGDFSFEFVVPKDINYAYGNGKISLYGNSETEDAAGSEIRFLVGGIDPNGIVDNQGPEVKMYFNNEKFVNGGLTDENPILIAELFDENGINTVGNGIGHDIVAVLDNETGDPIVLNDYYNASLDTYKSGKLTYNFKGLAAGSHRLKLKVWDVNNNSSEATIEFEVQEKQQIELRHVLNYPNPFTTSTAFFFEHNQYCSPLSARIQIFTISGKLVRTINREVLNECYRSDAIEWDGKDDYGDQLAKGVYVYKLTVRNQDNEQAEKIEKCVILK